jgi:hypothetical protein
MSTLLGYDSTSERTVSAISLGDELHPRRGILGRVGVCRLSVVAGMSVREPNGEKRPKFDIALRFCRHSFPSPPNSATVM